MQRLIFMLTCGLCLLCRCQRIDLTAPVLLLHVDSSVHYLNVIYTDPGAEAIDDQQCNLNIHIITTDGPDIYHYGTYQLNYSVADAAGNTATAIRVVDIILNRTDYYNEHYTAVDTCTSGIYTYTGLIEDCDCADNSIIVGNISNFGLSALFTLPLSGQYNEWVTLDTMKAAINFNGSAIMSTAADTLHWNYTIADSVSTDVCRSVWVKQ